MQGNETEIETLHEYNLFAQEDIRWALGIMDMLNRKDVVNKARSSEEVFKVNRAGLSVTNKSIITPVDTALHVYTDASSATSGARKGAAAGAVLYGKSPISAMCHFDKKWGTGKGELVALGCGLKMVLESSLFNDAKEIHIYVDSEYVVKSLAKGWINNWMERPGEFSQRIVGYDAWVKIAKMYNKVLESGNTLYIHHVRSHVMAFGNTVADLIAGECREHGTLSAERLKFICALFGDHVQCKVNTTAKFKKPIKIV